jgi:ribosomal protein L17
MATVAKGILGRLKAGKDSVLRMSSVNVPIANSTNFNIGGDVINADLWAEEIMRDRGVKKIELGLLRDLEAMGKSNTTIKTKVDDHFNQIRTNLKDLHGTFMKVLKLEYARGKDTESAKLAAYSNVKDLITSAIRAAEVEKPIDHIIALSKKASLQVS